MTSLRSSSVGVSSTSGAAQPPSRARRNSKTEDKGLSFFKTALRPKDGRAGKAEEGGGDVKEVQGASKKPNETSPNQAKDRESSKSSSSAAAAAKAPSSTKTKSGADSSAQASANAKEGKKEPVRKPMQTRKIPISSSQSSHRSKS